MIIPNEYWIIIPELILNMAMGPRPNRQASMRTIFSKEMEWQMDTSLADHSQGRISLRRFSDFLKSWWLYIYIWLDFLGHGAWPQELFFLENPGKSNSRWFRAPGFWETASHMVPGNEATGECQQHIIIIMSNEATGIDHKSYLISCHLMSINWQSLLSPSYIDHLIDNIWYYELYIS